MKIKDIHNDYLQTALFEYTGTEVHIRRGICTSVHIPLRICTWIIIQIIRNIGNGVLTHTHMNIEAGTLDRLATLTVIEKDNAGVICM